MEQTDSSQRGRGGGLEESSQRTGMHIGKAYGHRPRRGEGWEGAGEWTCGPPGLLHELRQGNIRC